MKRYYLTEDIRLEKLPVRYSDKLTEKIEEIEFYNKFEKENLKLWLNDLKGIVSWLSNPVIAWDNQNIYTHYDNGEIYIEKYGILFQVLTYKDKQGVEHNFVYVIDIILTPQDYNLNVPSNLFENKKYKQYNTMKNTRNKVRLTESQLHQVIKESVRKMLNELEHVHISDGYDQDGFDKNGYDKDGYDREGWNRDGMHLDGYSKAEYDAMTQEHDQLSQCLREPSINLLKQINSYLTLIRDFKNEEEGTIFRYLFESVAETSDILSDCISYLSK